MKTLVLLASLVFAMPLATFADDAAPDELVKRITNDVLESVKSDRQLAAGDRRKALELAEQKVMPYIDFNEAARLATGRAWQGATPEQQKRIAEEFRAMLVRIYTSAIDTYRGQTMRVLPLRMPAGATEVTVRNQYLKPGAPPVPVEYAMRKGADGWKIYDITVEGVSLVLTYRAEFEQVVRASGVDGLIKRLREKNA